VDSWQNLSGEQCEGVQHLRLRKIRYSLPQKQVVAVIEYEKNGEQGWSGRVLLRAAKHPRRPLAQDAHTDASLHAAEHVAA
jgi:hypothetical protein